jgi:hypothetical protein
VFEPHRMSASWFVALWELKKEIGCEVVIVGGAPFALISSPSRPTAIDPNLDVDLTRPPTPHGSCKVHNVYNDQLNGNTLMLHSAAQAWRYAPVQPDPLTQAPSIHGYLY